jgi:hypothetical protein
VVDRRLPGVIEGRPGLLGRVRKSVARTTIETWSPPSSAELYVQACLSSLDLEATRGVWNGDLA